MSLTVIHAPDYVALLPKKISIFLGGSIENGAARNWQQELIDYLHIQPYADQLEILNPRRLEWDATWPIEDPNHAGLREQINWELYHQDKADILIYNCTTSTVAPITLLELGTYAPRNPIIHIEDGYKRHANVKITADHFGWEYHETHAAFIQALDARIKTHLGWRKNSGSLT